MSWVGNANNKQLAKKDVKVFKVLYGEDKTWKKLDPNYKPVYMSPFYVGRYELGTLNKTTLDIRNYFHDPKNINIGRGFHSYSLQECNWAIDSDYALNVYTRHGRCIQSFVLTRNSRCLFDKSFTTPYVNVKVVECTIPAGSTYYQNEDGEIVSNMIIVNKEIK